jgi:hypothetical protein
MTKRIVRYEVALEKPRVGVSVAIRGVHGHDSELVTNGHDSMIRTSTVVRVDESTGEFETLNSIYQLGGR